MQSFYFRKFTINDKEALYNAIKGKEVVRHMASGGFALADCEWIINDTIQSWKERGYGSWAVIDKYSDVMIGWAGFKFWKENEIELLCVLQPESWGLGKRILFSLLDKGFNEMNFDSIYLLLPLSRRSFNFVKKFGFIEVGEEDFKDERFKKFVLHRAGYLSDIDVRSIS